LKPSLITKVSASKFPIAGIRFLRVHFLTPVPALGDTEFLTKQPSHPLRFKAVRAGTYKGLPIRGPIIQVFSLPYMSS
jgi:hypothetical protein